VCLALADLFRKLKAQASIASTERNCRLLLGNMQFIGLDDLKHCELSLQMLTDRKVLETVRTIMQQRENGGQRLYQVSTCACALNWVASV